jgi:hypothetical protein
MASVKFREGAQGGVVSFRCKECGSFLGHWLVVSNTPEGEVYLVGLPSSRQRRRFRPKIGNRRFIGLPTQGNLQTWPNPNRFVWRCKQGHPRVRRRDRLGRLEGVDKKPYPEFYV